MFEAGAPSGAKPSSEGPHENCIVGIISGGGGGGSGSGGGSGENSFLSAGLDGRVAEWVAT